MADWHPGPLKSAYEVLSSRAVVLPSSAAWKFWKFSEGGTPGKFFDQIKIKIPLKKLLLSFFLFTFKPRIILHSFISSLPKTCFFQDYQKTSRPYTPICHALERQIIRTLFCNNDVEPNIIIWPKLLDLQTFSFHSVYLSQLMTPSSHNYPYDLTDILISQVPIDTLRFHSISNRASKYRNVKYLRILE